MATVSTSDCVQEFFEHDVASFILDLEGLQASLGDDQLPDNGHVADLTAAIRRQSRACRDLESQMRDTRAVREAQRQFQEAIAPWFDQSWFMRRAKTKPRGYPGDFELLNGIYDRRVKSSGWGACLDQYFLESDLGRAVRARMESAREFLNDEVSRAEGTVRILNVACGPCREYLVGLEYPPGKEVEIVCVDSDIAALDFVRTHVAPAPQLRAALELVQLNALRLRSASRNQRRFGKLDIIYSIGLLDYIPDKLLVPMLTGLRQSLNPGGVLLAAFKDARRYDHCEYQWFVDWFFLQRTEEECRSLLNQAGFEDNALWLTRDATQIILNYRAFAPALRQRTLLPAEVRGRRPERRFDHADPTLASHDPRKTTPARHKESPTPSP